MQLKLDLDLELHLFRSANSLHSLVGPLAVSLANWCHAVLFLHFFLEQIFEQIAFESYGTSCELSSLGLQIAFEGVIFVCAWNSFSVPFSALNHFFT